MKLDFTRTSKTIYTEVGNRLLHKHSEIDKYDAPRARVLLVIP